MPSENLSMRHTIINKRVHLLISLRPYLYNVPAPGPLQLTGCINYILTNVKFVEHWKLYCNSGIALCLQQLQNESTHREGRNPMKRDMNPHILKIGFYGYRLVLVDSTQHSSEWSTTLNFWEWQILEKHSHF